MTWRMSWGALALLGGLLLGGAPVAQAEEPAASTQTTIGVKGLDTPELQAALEAALNGHEAVEGAKAEAGKVTVRVKPEKTLKASDVAAAVKALSTDAKPLAVELGGVMLGGTVDVTVSGTGDAPEATVAEALKGAGPAVEKVEAAGSGTFRVTFAGAKGASVGELDAALKAKLGVKEGGPVPAVSDVAWTAPKAAAAEAPKKPGHG